MNIAFYLRLSAADGDLGVDGKNESNSIENQRLLLQNFVEAREDIEGEIFEFTDDGFSGTNFDRPAFKEMIEAAKKGRIDLILVKDLSRLGRDYITAGDYIEQIFPMLGVRFIAVNSNYDSDKFTNATMGFDMAVNNLVNTLYSRDLSKKMKSSNQTRWKNGYNTAGATPFGYMKDSENKGKWRIDPEAAAIVREIFDKAIEGLGTAQIANYLNEQGYPTPWVYNQLHNRMKLAHLKTKDTERLWDVAKVSIILKRYEYTGALVRGKRKNLSVGSKKMRAQPMDTWIIVDGVNEGIVTKEEFEEAQNAIKYRKKVDFCIEQSYLLKGKARCGNCGLCLGYDGTGYEETFVCRHGRQGGKHSACCKDKYSVKQIEGQVFHSLKMLFILLAENGFKLAEQEKAKISYTHNELKWMEKEKEICREEKIRQYEAYANGIITKEVYIKKKQRLDAELERLENAISSQKTEVEEASDYCTTLSKMVDSARTFSGMERLTAEMVNFFVEAVFVYDANSIEIVFKNDELLREIAEKSA